MSVQSSPSLYAEQSAELDEASQLTQEVIPLSI